MPFAKRAVLVHPMRLVRRGIERSYFGSMSVRSPLTRCAGSQF